MRALIGLSENSIESKLDMKCPPILETAIVTDNAELTASLSCILNHRGYYLPVLDGPRIKRPDGPDEAVRRNNAIARASVKQVILTDLSTEQQEAMASILPSSSILKINGHDLSQVLKKKQLVQHLYGEGQTSALVF